MPKYSFTALNLENKKVKGTADARDEADLRRLMRTRDLIPLKLTVVGEKNTGYKLKAQECAEFSRQLASMLSSGITAVRALEIIKDSDNAPAIRMIFAKLHKDISQGMTVSEAMRLQKRAFPELLINMYASGEASGQLERVASKMAVHYEKENRLNGKIKGAMMYPMILGVVTVLVVLGLFIFILPNFFDTLTGFGIELPGMTKVMISISGFLTSKWYMLILAVMLTVACVLGLLSVPKVRLAFDKFKVYAPVIGKLLKTIYTARFARTLSSLYSSGISMINALEITATIIGNKYIESQFGEVMKDVRNGETLSVSVAKVDGMQKKLASTMLIGEESGRLDVMLESTAENFDYDAEQATSRLVQLIEPIMLVVMAVVVGGIMISVMMPVFSMYNQADSMGG